MESTIGYVQSCLDRLRAGDPTARNDLITCTAERLQRLASRMVRDHPQLRRWVESTDLAQAATARLCKSLDREAPSTPLHYFNVATLHLRRELIDLHRHWFGPEGSGAYHATPPAQQLGSSTPPDYQPAAPMSDAPDHFPYKRNCTSSLAGFP